MYWLIHLPDGEILYKFETKIDITKYTFYITKRGDLNWTPGYWDALFWRNEVQSVYKPYHLYLKKVKNV